MRSWCMRMARSTSPRRRKRLPSANCSSTVWGFSFATCRNDSIALSGCSFNRKFRPRKYDDGSARDSERSDLMSMRAATQPMPKKTGRARSHQNSNSMRRLWRGRDERLRRGLAQAPELAALAHDRGHPREEPDHHAGHEHDEQDEHERGLPDLAGQPVQLDHLRVLDGEPDEDHDDDESQDPDDGLHARFAPE